jgi:hypothetical protein
MVILAYLTGYIGQPYSILPGLTQGCEYHNSWRPVLEPDTLRVDRSQVICLWPGPSSTPIVDISEPV